MTQKQVIDILKDNRPFLEANYGVARIGIFGSYAKNTPTEESDVDMVIEFKRPPGLKFIELAEYLEKVLGRKVDLLTFAGINSIRIKEIREDIKRNIVYA